MWTGESLSETKRREVLQLLRDYRSWKTAYGGAGLINMEAMGQHGPAGLIYEGMTFDREDRYLMRQSIALLDHALTLLRKDHFALWRSLVEPYLGDPADNSIVDQWREQAKRTWEFEKEDNFRGERYTMKRSIFAWYMVKRHDAAIAMLADILREADLYAIFAKRMSKDQERKVEDQNAEILAVFERNRASGMVRVAAVRQTAEDFRISTDTVDRIIEFRDHFRRDECTVDDCERSPFAQNLCQRHYQKSWRDRKNKKSA